MRKAIPIVVAIAILAVVCVDKLVRSVMNGAGLPKIVETIPANFCQNVPIDLKAIRFTFDREMRPLISYTIASGVLSGPEEHWENQNKILSINLQTPLLAGATYAVILNPPGHGTPMMDVLGNPLKKFSLVFVTEDPERKRLEAMFGHRQVCDTDKDGLQDDLETEIGTNIYELDTDNDGLSDYEEYCKYRTNATKGDSDSDGRTDNCWEERREYTYTIEAICQIKPPVDVEAMNDLFQDAKSVSPGMFEVVLYPNARPHLVSEIYTPEEQIPDALKKYSRPTFTVNYSGKMRKKVRDMVAQCATKRDVINRLQIEMGQMQIVDQIVNPMHLHYENGRPTYVGTIGIDRSPAEISKSLNKLLEQTYFADSMFKKRQFASCVSRGILRAGLLRAAGLPTRLVSAIPLLYGCESEKESLIQRLQNEKLREGVYVVAKANPFIVDHSYNEVYLNNHWIRVDYAVNEGIFFADRYPFVKILTFADWSEVDFSKTWGWENWPDNRPYRTLSVEDRFPKYASVYTKEQSFSNLLATSIEVCGTGFSTVHAENIEDIKQQ